MLSAFEDAYKHELFITSCINNLVKIAKELNDNATQVFLNWFVNEQVEEESSTDKVVQMLRKVKDNVNGLFIIDSKLGKRE